MHSPIKIDDKLAKTISSIGTVRYLIAPNWIHYTWIPDCQKHFPDSLTFVSPGVVERAASKGGQLSFYEQLSNESATQWANEIDQRIADSGYHREKDGVIELKRAFRRFLV